MQASTEANPEPLEATDIQRSEPQAENIAKETESAGQEGADISEPKEPLDEGEAERVGSGGGEGIIDQEDVLEEEEEEIKAEETQKPEEAEVEQKKEKEKEPQNQIEETAEPVQDKNAEVKAEDSPEETPKVDIAEPEPQNEPEAKTSAEVEATPEKNPVPESQSNTIAEPEPVKETVAPVPPQSEESPNTEQPEHTEATESVKEQPTPTDPQAKLVATPDTETETMPTIRRSIIQSSQKSLEKLSKERANLVNRDSEGMSNLKEQSVRQRSRPQLDPIMTPNPTGNDPAQFELNGNKNELNRPSKNNERPQKKKNLKRNTRHKAKPKNNKAATEMTLKTENMTTDRSQILNGLKSKYGNEETQVNDEPAKCPDQKDTRQGRARGWRGNRTGARRRGDFDTTGLQNMKMNEYNSLLDGNLKKFFCSPEKVRHLSKVGLITRNGILVQNPEVFLRNKQNMRRYRSRPLLGHVSSQQHQAPHTHNKKTKQTVSQKQLKPMPAPHDAKENRLPKIRSKHSKRLLGVSNKMVQSTLSEKDVKSAMKAKSVKAKKRLRKGLSPLGQMWFRVKQNQNRRKREKQKAKGGRKEGKKNGVSKKQYISFLKKVQDVYSFNV